MAFLSERLNDTIENGSCRLEKVVYHTLETKLLRGLDVLLTDWLITTLMTTSSPGLIATVHDNATPC